MQHVWTRLALHLSEGGLPHAPGVRAGRCQGEAPRSELQDVRRSAGGDAPPRLREHPHPPVESDGEDKNKVLQRSRQQKEQAFQEV